jgi:hypothetical protein
MFLTFSLAILERFKNMRLGNVICAIEVGYGACDFNDAMKGARRKSKAFSGLLERGAYWR